MSRLQKGIISAVDTETVNGYAIVLANERRSWVANSFETCIKPIISDINHKKTGSRTFFWNITYDAQAICKYLPEENLRELLEDNQTIYNNRYSILFIRGKVFKIRDMKLKRTMSGYELSQFYDMRKLEDMAQKYLNEGKLKNNIIDEITIKAQTHTDNELYWIFIHNLDLIKKYCQKDALLTKRLGDYLSDNIYDMYNFKLSSYASKTGIGKKLTKDSVGYENYGKNKKVLCYPNFYETSLPARIAKESYHGGIFDASQRGTFDTCTGIDISSAYPAEMINLPNWSNGDFIRVNQDTLEETDIYGWVQACFNYSMIPYTTDMINVWDEYHKDNRDVKEMLNDDNHQSVVALNKRKFYPTGERVQTITLLEYRFLKKYKYLLDNNFNGFVWRKNNSKKQYHNPFKWIDKVYKMKQNIKKIGGKDSYKYSLTKIPMNSMYGTTAQKIGYAEFKNYFYASSITGGTRIQISEMLEHVGYKNCISIATDGILLKGNVNLPKKYTEKGLGSWDVDYYLNALILANGMYRLEREHDDPDKRIKQGLRGMLSYAGDLKDALEKNRDKTSFIPDTKARPITLHQSLIWHRYSKEDLNVFKLTGRALNCNADTTKHWNGIKNFGSLLDGNFHGKRFTVDEVNQMSKKAMKNLPDGVYQAEGGEENNE